MLQHRLCTARNTRLTIRASSITQQFVLIYFITKSMLFVARMNPQSTVIVSFVFTSAGTKCITSWSCGFRIIKDMNPMIYFWFIVCLDHVMVS